MTHHTNTRRPPWYPFYASAGRFSSTLLLSTFFLGACDATSRPGDTLGLQTSARWEWHARPGVGRGPPPTPHDPARAALPAGGGPPGQRGARAGGGGPE